MKTKQETLLDVMGMSCPSCIRHINEALSGLQGVASVEVRISDGKVLVAHDPNAASIESLIAALDEAGYESSVSAAA